MSDEEGDEETDRLKALARRVGKTAIGVWIFEVVAKLAASDVGPYHAPERKTFHDECE